MSWDHLQSIRLRAYPDGRAEFTLHTRGEPAVIPLEAAREGFIEELQSLPGFDNAALVRALAGPCRADVVCWRESRHLAAV